MMGDPGPLERLTQVGMRALLRASPHAGFIVIAVDTASSDLPTGVNVQGFEATNTDPLFTLLTVAKLTARQTGRDFAVIPMGGEG